MKRLESLDALRGFDMMFIMGFASLVYAVCAALPCGSDCALAVQMTHPEWGGLTHHDTIFPLFLFIAGVSFTFSFAKQKENGVPRKRIYLKILRRLLILIAFGLVYNGFFKFEFSTLRFFSVLGRIGLAWAVAAVLYMNFKPSVLAAAGAAILIGYWLLVMLVPAPDAPAGCGPFSYEGNIVGYVDRSLFPDHLYKRGMFDPEGLLSTLPAIVTALLGMFAGNLVRRTDIGGNRKSLLLLAGAVACLVSGLVWSNWCPVNKKLWSSSFVLLVGAYSLAMFALFYWIIDVKGWKGWIMPFKVIGMNSITIYMAQRFISFNFTSKFFLGGLASLVPEAWGNVIITAGALLLAWLLLYFLYRKKIFLKI